MKNWPKNRPKNDAKIYIYIYAMGGSKMIKIDKIWPGGSGGCHFINFLKFSHFLQKRSRFRPPKSTPKVGLLKMSFPTKTPVLLLQWGSENVTFWGVGGRTAFCKKCRHYYIAIFHFRGRFLTNFIDFGPPPRGIIFFIFSRPNLSDIKWR
jgi:hypothetical protein